MGGGEGESLPRNKVKKISNSVTIKISDGRSDILFSQVDCINMGHKRLGMYAIQVKIT